MPPEKTEGITPERLDRLWEHLLKLERLTGRKLRLTPRKESWICPISNFAPDKDSSSAILIGASPNGVVSYCAQFKGDNDYKIYEPRDSAWWQQQPLSQRREATEWIKNKLKERNAN